MAKDWREKMYCATVCSKCNVQLAQKDNRILSSYDDAVICMDCKKNEEARPDYEQVSKKMIGQCMADMELKQSDPEAYCYSHFYPFKC